MVLLILFEDPWRRPKKCHKRVRDGLNYYYRVVLLNKHWFLYCLSDSMDSFWADLAAPISEKNAPVPSAIKRICRTIMKNHWFLLFFTKLKNGILQGSQKTFFRNIKNPLVVVAFLKISRLWKPDWQQHAEPRQERIPEDL